VCSTVLHAVVAGLLASSHYPEGPATGHLGTGFILVSLCLKANADMVHKLQVATTCFSCGPSDLNFLDPYFKFTYTSMHNNHCHRAAVHWQLKYIIIIIVKILSNCAPARVAKTKYFKTG
jgi:hypothetical protein